MATTAQWVFDRAIHLMDEQNESTGSTKTSDTKEYEFRTLSILNVLRHELYPISDTYAVVEPGKRPIVDELLSFDQEIGLDDGVAQGIMPYGLAAHLMLGENDALANYFSQRYAELYSAMMKSMPSVWEDIPTAYGGLSV
ncbi:hypothetical protein ACTQ33_01030 [Candidatus Avoscillospira sp. LCP25S3_F1]|uniref:hypothetical protein n=1 Tax=Candidatus Avoscillospira sp. LCP25S3_F1 TaxID=3438825 RepID=UPI003F8F5AF6